MKKFNFRLHSYFIDENGIDNWFKIVAQVFASAALFKLVSHLSKKNMPFALVTAVFSLALLSLSFYYGSHKFWIPLIRKIYGNRENISIFEALGGVRNLYKLDVILAFSGCMALFIILNAWFDAIINIAII